MKLAIDMSSLRFMRCRGHGENPAIAFTAANIETVGEGR